MTMRSPIVAMLWENWRLSRNEAAQRLAQGIVAASAALTFFDADATIAFWILIATHAFFWFSIAKLNGGRFMDGYKPGFPLYLLYSRPVPTVTIVGVAMVYDAVSCTAFYLVSAAFLRFAFGPPLPLFSMTVFLMAYHFACTCVQWSTRNRVVQWIGSMVTFFPFLALLKNRMASPLQVEFSLLENALMVLVGVVSFGLTVAGVARQRRGDAGIAPPRTVEWRGFSDWLAGLFRFPCPTSSPTRAQVWFDLKSSGLPVLAIGLAIAIVPPLLFAIGIPVAAARPYAVLSAMVSVPAVLTLGGNAFGIRRRQGRTYASAFEATQPAGNAGAVTESKFSVNATPAQVGEGVTVPPDVAVAVADVRPRGGCARSRLRGASGRAAGSPRPRRGGRLPGRAHRGPGPAPRERRGPRPPGASFALRWPGRASSRKRTKGVQGRRSRVPGVVRTGAHAERG